MTSLSLTEEEVIRILSNNSHTFDDIVSELWEARKDRGVKPGSLSTISRALKNLHQKGFASYDVVERKWRATSLSRWILHEGKVPTMSGLALSQVTQPLLSKVEGQPGKLIELLSETFVYSFAKDEKLSAVEEMILKQTKTKLTVFTKDHATAIEAIWSNGVKRLVGDFSSLMAAILLYQSSIYPEDRTRASEFIPKIVEQWYKPLIVELGTLVSKLADLDKPAPLSHRKKTREGPSKRRQ